MLHKPERLSPGETIGIVAPASAPPDPKAIDAGVAALEKLGFKTKLARHVRARHGFIAGSDRDRAADLMQMFSDRKVQAIFCVRGGYGTARLMPFLDFGIIRRNPKIFIGYSDITSLHCAFLTQSGLVSFHGPMLNSDFIKPDMPAFTLESCKRVLMEPHAPGSISIGYKARTVEVLRKGMASGRLVGGNITLLCATLGTPFQPEFRRAILFLEDLDELPYRYDRMLTQLLNAGLLQQVAGVAVGINSGCEDPKAKKAKEYRQTLRDVLVERLMPLKVPVVMGLPFGHVPHNATLPVGLHATLNGTAGDLIVDEPAVI